jgi:phosphohistidine phosphatase SixA
MKFRGTIRWDEKLYASDGEAWLAALRGLPASVGSALVVAHSPGIEEAAALLCGAPPNAFDVPTAGIVALAADVPRWADLSAGAATIHWMVRPKMVGAL